MPAQVSGNAASSQNLAPITASNPLFANIQTDVTASFLSDVVDLINRSPALLLAINDSPEAKISFTDGGGEGGSASPNGQVIYLARPTSFDDTTPYILGASATGEEPVTPAGQFVGLLAHEEGHENDANLAAFLESV